VADVAADIDGEVSADGTGLRLERVGGSEDLASGGDDLLALPSHGDDGSRGEVLNETVEERLGREVGVVTGGLLLGGPDHLETDELESLLLEAGDDLSDKRTLNTIGLDGDEGTLLVGSGDTTVGDLGLERLEKESRKRTRKGEWFVPRNVLKGCPHSEGHIKAYNQSTRGRETQRNREAEVWVILTGEDIFE